MKIQSAEEAEAAVDEPEEERGEEPDVELGPVGPAEADVEHGEHVVGFAEEFVACAADDGGEGEDEDQEDQELRDDAHYDVFFAEDHDGCHGLGLIELDFDDGPTDGVDGGLGEHNDAQPAVEEVEGLVGKAGCKGEDRLSGGEENTEWSEGVGEGTNTVGKGADSSAGVELARVCFDWGDPKVISHANKGEDGKVAREDG